jgi:hypothetical protein
MAVTDDASAMRALRRMPNVGPAVAGDLLLLDIRSPDELKGQDPKALYDRLCEVTGQRHDPCMLDTMMAVVDFAESGVPRKWWEFTAERKRRYPGV